MSNSTTTSQRGVLAPGAFGTRVVLTRHEVRSPGVARFVERYWSVRWALDDGESFTSETLPHPTVNVVFEAEGSAAHGIPHARFSRTLVGEGWVFGVKFRPGAFAPFMDAPIGHLTNTSLPVEKVFGDAIVPVDAAIRASNDDTRAITLFERFLEPRLPAYDPELDRVLEIMRVALDDPSLSDVDAFAARASVPVRTLQRLFKEHIGVAPKWVLRRFRIQEAAERAMRDPDVSFAALAHALGYADQAHFARDFRAHVGKTPTEYVAHCADAKLGR